MGYLATKQRPNLDKLQIILSNFGLLGTSVPVPFADTIVNSETVQVRVDSDSEGFVAVVLDVESRCTRIWVM